MRKILYLCIMVLISVSAYADYTCTFATTEVAVGKKETKTESLGGTAIVKKVQLEVRERSTSTTNNFTIKTNGGDVIYDSRPRNTSYETKTADWSSAPKSVSSISFYNGWASGSNKERYYRNVSLTIPTQSMDFGSVVTNGTSSKTLNVFATSTPTFSCPTGFSATITSSNGMCYSVTITFLPTAVQNYSGDITISTGTVVSVSGSGSLATPTGLAVNSTTYTSATLSWNGVSGATGYVLVNKTTGAEVVVNATSYTWNGLENATSYNFAVKSAVGSVYSSESSAVTATTRTLGAPTINSTSSTHNTVTLNWSAVADATSYVVYGNGTSYTTESNSYTVSGLASDTQYSFYVKALYNSTYSVASNTVNVTTMFYDPSRCTAVTDANEHKFTYYGGAEYNYDISPVSPFPVKMSMWLKSGDDTGDTRKVQLYYYTGGSGILGYEIKKDGKIAEDKYNPFGEYEFPANTNKIQFDTDAQYGFYVKNTAIYYVPGLEGDAVDFGTVDANSVTTKYVTVRYANTMGQSLSASVSGTGFTLGTVPSIGSCAVGTTTIPITYTAQHGFGEKYATVTLNNGLSVGVTIKVTVASSTPTGLAVTSTTNNAVSLSWDKLSGVDGYRINNVTLGTHQDVTGDNTTSYTWGGLNADTDYTFTIMSLKNSTPSTASAQVTGHTLFYDSSRCVVMADASELSITSSNSKDYNFYEKAGFVISQLPLEAHFELMRADGVTDGKTVQINSKNSDDTWQKKVWSTTAGNLSINNFWQFDGEIPADSKAIRFATDATKNIYIKNVVVYYKTGIKADNVDFGMVSAASAPIHKTLTIHYANETPLTISSFSGDGFSVGTLSETAICGVGSTTLDVTFTPQAAWEGTVKTGKITFSNGATAEVNLQATVALAKVQNFAVTNTTSNSISLSWTAGTYAEKYEITVGGVTTTVTGTSYTFNGLESNTSYNYSIVAVRGDQKSEASEVSGTTKLAAPNPTATPSYTSVQLDWTAVSGATSYIVRRTGVADISVNTNSCNVTGLDPFTDYTFTVVSVKDGVEHTSSNVNTKTLKLPAATNFAASNVGPFGMTLSWNAVTSATGYKLVNITTSATQTINGTSVNLTELEVEKEYQFELITMYGAAEQEKTSTLTQKTILPAPTNLAVTDSTDNSISLSWNAVQYATGYRVTNVTLGTSQDISAENTTYTWGSLSKDTKYQFMVKALLGSAQSEASNTAEATTLFYDANLNFDSQLLYIKRFGENNHGTSGGTDTKAFLYDNATSNADLVVGETTASKIDNLTGGLLGTKASKTKEKYEYPETTSDCTTEYYDYFKWQKSPVNGIPNGYVFKSAKTGRYMYTSANAAEVPESEKPSETLGTFYYVYTVSEAPNIHNILNYTFVLETAHTANNSYYFRNYATGRYITEQATRNNTNDSAIFSEDSIRTDNNNQEFILANAVASVTLGNMGNITADEVSNNGIKFSWKAVNGASDYWLQYSIDGGTTFADSISLSDTTYTIDNLQEDVRQQNVKVIVTAGDCFAAKSQNKSLYSSSSELQRVKEVDSLYWTNAAGDNDWDNFVNWNLKEGSLYSSDVFGDKLHLFVPKNGANKYPSISKMPSHICTSTTGKIATCIEVEYGAALPITYLAAHAESYDTIITSLVLRGDDRAAQEWILVGPNVRPFHSNVASQMISGDYYLNNEPKVFMHQLSYTQGATPTVTWDTSFPDMNTPIVRTEGFAVSAPNKYGPSGRRAELYYKNDPDVSKKSLGTADVKWDFVGRLENSYAEPTYSTTVDEWTIMTNTFLGNIDVAKFLTNHGGQVAIWSFNGETGSEGSFSTVTSGKIKPQHVFFYRSAMGESVTLTENDCDFESSTIYTQSFEPVASSTLQLTISNGDYGSQTTVSYDPNLDDDLLGNDNLAKLFTGYDNTPDICTFYNNSALYSQTINSSITEVPLAIRCGQTSMIALLQVSGADEFKSVYLQDKQLDTLYNLKQTNDIDLSLVQGYNMGRFYLLFEFDENNSPATGNNGVKDASLDIFADGGKNVVVTSNGENVERIEVIDCNGKSKTFAAGDTYNVVNFGAMPAGVYVVKATTQSISKVEKIIVR